MRHWWLLAVMVLFGGAVGAQSTYPGISPEQQKMLEKLKSMTPEQRQAFAASMQAKAAKAQECFSKVDQSKLQALEARSRAVSAKVDALCAAGKTTEAESYAMDEARKMMSDPTARQMAECSKGFAASFDFSPKAMAAQGKTICSR